MKKDMERKIPTVRCAVYTRKSTEEGLEQEFNSLDAQRESGEAYIASQRHEGWTCVPTRYDDGGFSGGNLDRPALKRLLADIELGRIDCIVVYKVDRLSRSLIDFSKIMDVLERRQVSFVSVTQQFNTATSMGRLMLNVLLSFAQFEREIISERTRDKLAAARKKGKWIGGRPFLGYDVDSNGRGGRLKVNKHEADQVRQIFELYLREGSLMPTVREINRRGWRAKKWITKKGIPHGGQRFTKEGLHRLLTNVSYTGNIRFKDQLYPAEHEAIVSDELWKQVQKMLREHGRQGGVATGMVRNKHGALLKGLLHCKPCNCGMMHTYTTNGTKRYRYYVCMNAQKRGWDNCPTKSIPAGEIERFVVDRIRLAGQDNRIVLRVLEEAEQQSREGIETLRIEQDRIEREMARHTEEVRKLVILGSLPGETPMVARLADLQERIRLAERRSKEIGEQIAALTSKAVNETGLTNALSTFNDVWGSLKPAEQSRILHLLIERITYDGAEGNLAITFRPNGITGLNERDPILAAESALC